MSKHITKKNRKYNSACGRRKILEIFSSFELTTTTEEMYQTFKRKTGWQKSSINCLIYIVYSITKLSITVQLLETYLWMNVFWIKCWNKYVCLIYKISVSLKLRVTLLFSLYTMKQDKYKCHLYAMMRFKNVGGRVIRVERDRKKIDTSSQ